MGTESGKRMRGDKGGEGREMGEGRRGKDKHRGEDDRVEESIKMI